MDDGSLKRIDEIEKKIDLIYSSVEKTRAYFKWTLIISIVVIVLPGIILLFLTPLLINSITEIIPLIQ